MDHIDPERDYSNDRVVSLDNGNKIHIRRHNPYGLWRISYERGPVPQKLTGEYTEFRLALRDVEMYLEQIKREAVEIQVQKKGK